MRNLICCKAFCINCESGSLPRVCNDGVKKKKKKKKKKNRGKKGEKKKKEKKKRGKKPFITSLRSIVHIPFCVSVVI